MQNLWSNFLSSWEDLKSNTDDEIFKTFSPTANYKKTITNFKKECLHLKKSLEIPDYI